MGAKLFGPAKNPPVILADGTLVAPSSDEYEEWTSHVELSKDFGRTWKRYPDIHFSRGIIQPAIFVIPGGRLRMVNAVHEAHAYALVLGVSCAVGDSGRSWP